MTFGKSPKSFLSSNHSSGVFLGAVFFKTVLTLGLFLALAIPHRSLADTQSDCEKVWNTLDSALYQSKTNPFIDAKGCLAESDLMAIFLSSTELFCHYQYYQKHNKYTCISSSLNITNIITEKLDANFKGAFQCHRDESCGIATYWAGKDHPTTYKYKCDNPLNSLEGYKNYFLTVCQNIPLLSQSINTMINDLNQTCPYENEAKNASGLEELNPTPGCGNSILDPGEYCDGVSNPHPGKCDPTCHASCGDKVIATGIEECDDGPDGSPTCDKDCKIIPQNPFTVPGAGSFPCAAASFCGNGVVDQCEECDEGSNNGRQGSSCTPQCKKIILIPELRRIPRNENSTQ
ncbi:MAG: hypothetical protein U1F66_00855 [bacterium]